MQVVTNEQMRSVDQGAMNTYHIPGIVLMEHAAMGIYQKMKEWLCETDRIQIVCGVGNNGGDGLALARLLHIDGYQVCYSLVEHQVVSADAISNLQMVEALGIDCVDSLQEVDVVVDAIFGTGLHNEITGNAKVWIEKINQASVKVVSVDIPSGVSSNTGEILGCSVCADKTYTIARGKIGLYVYPGSACAGEISIVDLHVPEDLFKQCGSTVEVLSKPQIQAWLPTRKKHSHKGDYGKVLAIGGCVQMSGAISMAAKAALTSGCGLLTCAVPKSLQSVIQTNVLESMTLPLEEKDGHLAKEGISQLCLDGYTCYLIGCGIGRSEDIQEYLQALLDTDVPMVIDADGLVALKPLMKQYASRKNVILTPHLKEFADLMGVPLSEVEQHRMQMIDGFTEQYPNWTLVLKSETTIVAKGKYRWINSTGNNGLAVGGSGDVLAGIITGMLAQSKDCVQASCVSVYLHGYIADCMLEKESVYSILPTKLIACLEEILFSLIK